MTTTRRALLGGGLATAASAAFASPPSVAEGEGQTILCAGAEPPVIRWVEDHGLDPNTLSKRVDLNPDGTVTLHRFVTDADGHRVLVGGPACWHCGRSDDGAPRAATEPVTVNPRRPFPVSPQP